MKLLMGSSPQAIIAHVGKDNYRQHFGMFNGPRSGNRPEHAIALGAPWALDNDSFNGFDERRFMLMLNLFRGLPGCLFACAPDVVGKAIPTADLFTTWQPIIRNLGYPVAFVAQDGLENLPIRWDDFEALFIGGSTAWKLGPYAADIAAEAKQRRKHVHMGRVNSAIRLRYAQRIGADSVDGTGYARFLHKCKKAIPYLASRQLSLLEA